MQYIAFLDGMRAVAVLSVIAYHINPNWIPRGYLGVDIFFVISGFVIAMATQHKSQGASFWSMLTSFYGRRFRRIVPALVVCLIVTSLFTTAFVPETWLSQSLPVTGAAAFFGLSNFVLANGVDYFSPVTEFNPYTHTWSLGVEEQFYLLFPLFFYPWMIGKKLRRELALTVLLFSAATSFAIWLWLLSASPLNAFYQVYSRFWELAAGVLLYMFLPRFTGRSWHQAFPVLAAAGMIASFYMPLPTDLGKFANTGMVASTLLLIAALISSADGALSRSLSSNSATSIGRRSYSLYLWHWPVIVLLRWTWGVEGLLHTSIAVVVTFVLAEISYRYVETPFRRQSWLNHAPNFAVAALGLVTMSTGWSAYNLVLQNRPWISQSDVSKNSGDWLPVSGDRDGKYPGCDLDITAENLGVSYVSSHTRKGCGAAGRSETLFAIGDSHTIAMAPMMKLTTLATGAKTVIVSNAGCPLLFSIGRVSETCNEANRAGMEMVIGKIQPNDVVVLSSLRMPYLSTPYERRNLEDARLAAVGPEALALREQQRTEAEQVINQIVRRGAKVLFVEPTPVFASPPFRCADWFNQSNPICRDGGTTSRALIEEWRQPMVEQMAAIAADYPDSVFSWDPVPALCDVSLCESFRQGRPLFLDGDHLSQAGNEALAPSFIERIKQVLDRQFTNARTN